jgi:putative transposase
MNDWNGHSANHRFWRGRLPHWEVLEGRYFVTLRLANSLPYPILREIHDLAKQCSDDPMRSHDYARRIFRKMEAWLDHHHEMDWLSRPAVAALIAEALRFYQRQGEIAVHEYVIMPNHLHVFLTGPGNSLTGFLEKFKRWTARQANRVLDRPGQRFWQSEWFDHWSRSATEDERICAYIRNNPVAGGLVKRTEDWPYGSWHAAWPRPEDRPGLP